MTATFTPSPSSKQTYWTWRDWRIHYVQKGQKGPCLLLVHGFGASTDHWRKNIEILSQSYRVWAIDLLGFGRSQKPNTIYTGELWRDQFKAFCEEVIQEPVFIAGNSLGGYASLCFAVDCPEWVRGVILLNCAGRFTAPERPQPVWKQRMGNARQRVLRSGLVIDTMSLFLFFNARRRSQIRKVLQQVYKDKAAITDQLVEDIRRPSLDKGALQVFSAVFKSPPGRTLDILLQDLERPLFLLWGAADPWMTSAKTDTFREFYPAAALELLDAGHCPHDERPELVNAAIDQWITQQC
ncbi:Dihydrolipoyllysine-residue acetyltransferase component of acetoin cleaving system [Acaryochloris thomasi RCC1774]|uniref:Dihydrolipoyllysine-residue acetyltransferase component of acetoin cleaving system n=1 Tax=Acaryochloris thomasi RCC1774 TaxID=1764569 RepID=A0A2W1JPE6_9CYAN|nr:alpha/beta fold hydrolase [Acaryochloris thomasi]PZD75210.1 Dihydrolipoyllysine-residue acetyltransferase component of acetoin cleaving system [Acaryochloris thomasi RCC1774]